jgi:hypothetical protein
LNSLGFSLLAVLIATVSAFILGGLWCPVFFAKPWANASGLDAKKGYPSSTVDFTSYHLPSSGLFSASCIDTGRGRHTW